jgi:hypothetical protein
VGTYLRTYPILLFFCWDFGTWLDVEVGVEGVKKVHGNNWSDELARERITTKINKYINKINWV